MDYEDVKLQEDEIETPDLEKIVYTSEIYIDWLAERLNN